MDPLTSSGYLLFGLNAIQPVQLLFLLSDLIFSSENDLNKLLTYLR